MCWRAESDLPGGDEVAGFVEEDLALIERRVCDHEFEERVEQVAERRTRFHVDCGQLAGRPHRGAALRWLAARPLAC